MKVTIVHTNNKKQLLVSTKTMEKLLERIAKDDSKNTVTHFREHVPYMENNYEYYKDMPTWMHIYPAAEFVKDENNNLKMKACNGILLLKFGNITDANGVEGVKRSVAMLPSTFAALEGADGKSVIVLVKFSNEDDLLPIEEADAERLYRIAYQQILPVYQAIAKASVLTDGPKPSIEAGANLSFEPSMHNSFMMTLDAKPYFNSKAVAMKIDSNMHPQNQAFNTEDNQQMMSGSDTSEEEKKVDKNSVRENIMSMMQLLKSKYNFRYNTVMKFVEYMPKEKGWYGFQPVDPRVQKRMTLEVQLADIRVSIKDVRNFLESDYIKNYNPIDEYLFQCYDKWDGKDHIRALARTVPTNNPYWANWFYTWFLAMVEQWHNRTGRQYGNSVAPLLVSSRQGLGKSTFCRLLMPDALKAYYTESYDLCSPASAEAKLAAYGLINLDEFDKLGASKMPLLKNLMQASALNIRKAYKHSASSLPRIASFIGTSNREDLLVDRTGSRRFLCVSLKHAIDCTTSVEHKQLYAQLKTELLSGERSWFNKEEEQAIQQHNALFYKHIPEEEVFRLCFRFATQEDHPQEVLTLSATQLFERMKSAHPSVMRGMTAYSLSRILPQLGERVHTTKGNVYRVVEC